MKYLAMSFVYISILGHVMCVMMCQKCFFFVFIVYSSRILNCSAAWHCLCAVSKCVNLVYKVQVRMFQSVLCGISLMHEQARCEPFQ